MKIRVNRLYPTEPLFVPGSVVLTNAKKEDKSEQSGKVRLVLGT